MEMKNWKLRDGLERGGRGAQDEFLVRAFQPEVGRRIDAVGEVDADRADRACGSGCRNRRHAPCNRSPACRVWWTRKEMLLRSRVDIPHVMEDDAVDVVAQQGEAQLGAVEQERVAAEVEAGLQVARPGLVIGEAAMRGAAAAEEVLGDRHIVERIDARA